MSLQSFLQSIDQPPAVCRREVNVGERAVTIFVRELSAYHMASLLEGMRDSDGNVPADKDRAVRDRIVAASLCTEAGELALSEEEVGQLPFRLLKAIAPVVFEVNGLSAPDGDTEKKD